eukprot:GGOE01045145.1.p1 GENE.GGOE01045145.1~~GGOE01045145.1.p1  ORF type:complete len:143 (-),score=43.31 GGOE01045145.1:234-662(-)
MLVRRNRHHPTHKTHANQKTSATLRLPKCGRGPPQLRLGAEGFSGGEKKRNEILQLAVLEAELAVLDEIDSGLDVDALRDVAAAVNHFKRPTSGLLLITHYRRLLDLIEPDVIHIVADGRVVRSGDKSLSGTLEEEGFGAFN